MQRIVPHPQHLEGFPRGQRAVRGALDRQLTPADLQNLQRREAEEKIGNVLDALLLDVKFTHVGEAGKMAVGIVVYQLRDPRVFQLNKLH